MDKKYVSDDVSILDMAYMALLHDIGKFYQRTEVKSDLNEQELETTPMAKAGYHTHLHSGYTSRFFKEYLNHFDALEKISSEHHLPDDDVLYKIVRYADQTASAIDRQDEDHDYVESNKRGQFITKRMTSIMGDVDFGKKRNLQTFPLTRQMDMENPVKDYQECSVQEAAQEYKDLFKKFISEVKDNPRLKGKKVSATVYHEMYYLLNDYLVTVPASTYKVDHPTVSLFDHLKLTSAIASCLFFQEAFENYETYDRLKDDHKSFYLLELDVSGIQSFIYKVAEGADTKPGLVKALRGRSAYVGLITNAISYAFLDLFGLTEANILFNTGGGSVILLPYTTETQALVEEKATALQRDMYQIFHNDLTFVYGLLDVNRDELEKYKSESAIELRSRLGRNKMRKYSQLINQDFFFKKAQGNQTCQMCGNIIFAGKQCPICKSVEQLSLTLTGNDQYGIYYDFHHSDVKNEIGKAIDLGFVTIKFIKKRESLAGLDAYYVDGVNGFHSGNMKLSANLVPRDEYGIMNFEKIASWTGIKNSERFGDPKLAILKMDVDNLGGIFAFGLKSKGKPELMRSISKYVTLSRLMNYFFSEKLMRICKETSYEVTGEHKNVFYINYAGGDDLVIIGPVYGILYLAKNIDQEFSAYTGNENITISGGINIQGPKEPIRFGVQMAEDYLDQAKHADPTRKHAITLMNVRIPFEDYGRLLARVEEYRQAMAQGALSRTMVYNIMSNIRDVDMQGYMRMIPRVLYILYRAQTNKNNAEIEMVKKDILTHSKNESMKDNYVLLLKLAIMMTRVKEN